MTPTPLKMAQKIWGGTIKKRVRKSPASDKICTGYEWRMCHNDSLKFIEVIKPYMIIPYKINQIESCIKISKLEWNREFKCSFCELVYADRSGARRHELKEHINKGVLFKCTDCENEFKSKDSMTRHIRLKHKTEC
jgi:uncharacterized C2H2 Zn-finger protein